MPDELVKLCQLVLLTPFDPAARKIEDESKKFDEIVNYFTMNKEYCDEQNVL